MEVTQKTVRELIKQFTGQAQTLTIPRPFIRLTGDHVCALLLNQILYWSERTSDPEGWFHKSHEEWAEELCLTPYQVRRAAAVLEGFGVEHRVGKVGRTPKLHFRINTEVFQERLVRHLESEETSESTISKVKKLDNQETQHSESEVSSLSSKDTKITDKDYKTDSEDVRARALLAEYGRVVKPTDGIHYNTLNAWFLLIRQRLREGWPDAKLARAFQGCALDDWKERWRWNKVSDILKDRDSIEHFINLADELPKRAQNNGDGREKHTARADGRTQHGGGARAPVDRKWAVKNRVGG